MRKPLTHRGSMRLFRITADKTHRRNVAPEPMRGGIRM